MTATHLMYQSLQLPVFQNRMFSSAAEARDCATGDVLLAQDSGTGLISNQAFRPELMQYGPDYHNEQSLSSVFQAHLEDVSCVISKHFRGLSLVEVGCGKGHFLELLQAKAFEISGLDPAYDGSNPAIIKEYFTSRSGLKAGAIILRHVLEHVQAPLAFLSALREANGGNGRIYIEVPCFDWICDRRLWFDIFYEHVNYFRLPDFYRMFGTVCEAGHIFSGQYLYVVADLASLRTPRSSERFPFPEDFLAGVNRYAVRLGRARDSRRVVWGAASKGVIFSLFMQRAGVPVETIIDINPAKQGRFLPVTGLRVQSPEEATKDLPPGTQVYVMNGNYLEEIRSLTNNRFDYTSVDHDRV
jgi:hypothetical protein